MNQPSFFQQNQYGTFEPVRIDAMARPTDPDTSWDAAADALIKADTHRAICLTTLRAHPDGLTDFELADLVGLQQTSAGKRRGELRDQGLVVNSGRKRPAPSGSMSIVWQAVSRAPVPVSAAIPTRPSAVSTTRGVATAPEEGKRFGLTE